MIYWKKINNRGTKIIKWEVKTPFHFQIKETTKKNEISYDKSFEKKKKKNKTNSSMGLWQHLNIHKNVFLVTAHYSVLYILHSRFIHTFPFYAIFRWI